LDEISAELRNRSSAHMDDVIQPLPAFKEVDGTWVMDGEIVDGKIYQIPFDGTDAHAEAIERATSLTFLGDSTEEFDEELPCHMSGKMTRRRVILAKTY
jgi:hypothetical protein